MWSPTSVRCRACCWWSATHDLLVTSLAEFLAILDVIFSRTAAFFRTAFISRELVILNLRSHLNDAHRYKIPLYLMWKISISCEQYRLIPWSEVKLRTLWRSSTRHELWLNHMCTATKLLMGLFWAKNHGMWNILRFTAVQEISHREHFSIRWASISTGDVIASSQECTFWLRRPIVIHVVSSVTKGRCISQSRGDITSDIKCPDISSNATTIRMRAPKALRVHVFAYLLDRGPANKGDMPLLTTRSMPKSWKWCI